MRAGDHVGSPKDIATDPVRVVQHQAADETPAALNKPPASAVPMVSGRNLRLRGNRLDVSEAAIGAVRASLDDDGFGGVVLQENVPRTVLEARSATEGRKRDDQAKERE